MGEYLIDTTRVNNAGSNLATFEAQAGSILALHVWNLGPAGTVTTSEESVQKLTGPNRGSGTMVTGNYNGSAFPLKLDLGSYLMIAGSITSMPSISVSAGSESYIKGGSIQTYNPIGIGSVRIAAQGIDLSIIGSVAITSPISVSTGSEVYVKAGSIQTYSPLGVGSVRVAEWGITTPITTTGSFTPYGVGSIRIAEQGVTLGVSGIVNQGTNPWIVLGSFAQTNIGSVIIATNPVPISGVVNQGTSPWVVTGSTTQYGIGSVRIASQGQVPLTVEYYRDAFRISGATLLTSGTSFNIYTPGAGSKALLKGFTISTDTAMQVRVLFSGGTPTYLSSFRLPSSGTIAMNMIGIETSGAVDQPVAFGIGAPGSVDVTIFARDTL